MTDPLNLAEVAGFAGLTQGQVRQWTYRHGWPKPSRDRHGRLRFSEAQAVALREVAQRVRAGAEICWLLRDGFPHLDPVAPPAVPIRLDLTAIPDPADAEAQAARRLLVLGLIQQHAGRVRHAVAACARLHPRDRGPAVLLVIDAARRQNPKHAAWIDQALEV